MRVSGKRPAARSQGLRLPLALPTTALTSPAQGPNKGMEGSGGGKMTHLVVQVVAEQVGIFAKGSHWASALTTVHSAHLVSNTSGKSLSSHPP